MKGVVAQYLLAALSIVALVVINIWGKESEALNAALFGVITASVWGGVQRNQGIKLTERRQERDEEAE